MNSCQLMLISSTKILILVIVILVAKIRVKLPKLK